MNSFETLTPTRRWALTEVRSILSRILAQHGGRAYLFGSCAQGRAAAHSDIDIGIDSAAPLSSIAAIAEAMEGSAIPYHVDIVDMRRSDPAFAEIIRRQGIPWTI
jgi:predicted nucleotidyltransferase